MEGRAATRYKGGVTLISGGQERILSSANLMAQFHQLQVLPALPKPVPKHELQQALRKLV